MILFHIFCSFDVNLDINLVSIFLKKLKCFSFELLLAQLAVTQMGFLLTTSSLSSVEDISVPENLPTTTY